MKKIMYGALMVLLVGILGVILTINTSGVEAFTFSSVDLSQKKEIDGSKIKNIAIESPSVDVNLVPTSGDQVKVELAGKVGKKSKKLYKLLVEKNGDTVEISVEKENKFQFMMFNFTRVRLDVEVPEKVYDSIKIDASSADVDAKDIEAKEVAIEVKSGDILVDNAMVDATLFVQAQSGDIEAKDNQAKELVINASSGDVTASKNEANQMSIEVSSGDIESYDQKVDDISIHTASGDISVDQHEATGNITVEANSGDIDVNFTNTPESLVLDYRGNSGDGNADLDGMEFEENSEHRIIGKIGSGKYQLNARTTSGDFNLN